ncbi:MAG: hypothetical protein ABJH20_01315 [Rhizobiaceae bacterium]
MLARQIRIGNGLTTARVQPEIWFGRRDYPSPNSSILIDERGGGDGDGDDHSFPFVKIDLRRNPK